MNVDIIQIDEKVINFLQTQETVVPEESIYDALLQSRWFQNYISDRSDPLPQIPSAFYILETWSFLERYRKELLIPMRVNFCKTQKFQTPLNELIVKYFDCLNRLGLVPFCQYESVDANEMGAECKACNTCFVKDADANSKVVCPSCGTQTDCSTQQITHNDAKRINISQKYVYIKRTHFLNCINQFQGKQKTTIKEELLEKLRAELDKYNLIDYTQTEQRLQYAKVEKKHVHMFLKQLDMSKQHYENVALIYSKLTGKELNDISHLTDRLLADFDLFEQAHKTIVPFNMRKNFNYSFLLKQFLAMHGYEADSRLFGTLKTTERRAYHDEMYRKIFESLGWKYTGFF